MPKPKKGEIPEHLKDKVFKVGNPGGPGRPKGPPLKSCVKKIMRLEMDGKIESQMPEDMQALCEKLREELGMPKLHINEAIAMSLVALALRGDRNAIKDVFDQVDGPLEQQLKVSGNIGVFSWADLIQKANQEGHPDEIIDSEGGEDADEERGPFITESGSE